MLRAGLQRMLPIAKNAVIRLEKSARTAVTPRRAATPLRSVAPRIYIY
jgi:hypothetical protein